MLYLAESSSGQYLSLDEIYPPPRNSTRNSIEISQSSLDNLKSHIEQGHLSHHIEANIKYEGYYNICGLRDPSDTNWKCSEPQRVAKKQLVTVVIPVEFTAIQVLGYRIINGEVSKIYIEHSNVVLFDLNEWQKILQFAHMSMVTFVVIFILTILCCIGGCVACCCLCGCCKPKQKVVVVRQPTQPSAV